MTSTPTQRRVQRVRHELKRRELRLVRITPLGAHQIDLTFAGDELADFVSASFDDHVKFIVTDDAGQPVRRDYTPKHFDAAARELTIEFAIHGDGPASRWARRAVVGQTATVGGPRGSMIIPVDYDWHLLAGDATALPAVQRRLAELPARARVIVLLQVPEADRRPLASSAELELHWLDTPDELPAAIAALQLPPGEGFAWGAGEASVMARVRRVLLDQKHHPREAMRVSAYWKQGASEHHEDLA
ncbi:siderophore-interacting protein [Ramlibacter aurantiacus]|uniref:siderophore-interacting protein n=1 Tax=Ramlibacter aurantiacus TaxID=2801330 RepID=UPI001F32508F|nr:siderophore-interacting protein [Ramlibacter aurantiacus]